MIRVEDPDPKKRCSFLLKYGEDVTTYIAVSDIEAKEWMQAIQETQREAKSGKDAQKDISGITYKK
jgi:hypothetical protein